MRFHSLSLLLIATALCCAGCGDFDIERYVKFREDPKKEKAVASNDAKQQVANPDAGQFTEPTSPEYQQPPAVFVDDDTTAPPDAPLDGFVGEPAAPAEPVSSGALFPSGQSVSSGGENTAKRVSLRTGTALPQTLPGGTAIGVSVTYEVNGPISASSRFLWVVQSSKRSASIPVRLRQSGVLQTFMQGWQPHDKPFRCHIVEITSKGQKRVSDIVPLR